MELSNFIVPHPRIKADDLAVKARAVMRDSKVRALPVFENGKLIGILTRSDILKITSNKSNIQVKGLLWKPLISVDAATDVKETAKQLIGTGVKQLPVFKSNEYIGMVRDIDLLKAMLNFSPTKQTVTTLISKNPKVFSVGDPITKVWSAIRDHSGFPVIDRGKLVGIITSPDLLTSKKSRVSREAEHIKTSTNVGKIMRVIGDDENFVASPNTSTKEAAEKLIKTGVNILVIEENNKVVGIASRKDILRGFL